MGDLLDKLCMLDRDGFIYGQNLRLCTEARYICPVQQIIDTPLLRKLNQFRTFVRNVRPGDELDVQAQVSEKNLTPPPGNSSGNLEQQIANWISARRRYEQRASGKHSTWMGLFSGFRGNDRLVKPLRYRKNHAGRG